ncbi:hypothetical protein KIN20_019198 [Parelaphostrongylus tenuis]|uniref:Uncharacterized protein n=1 Tax=Parelaphostrongylus tenuis TaxID=148309 RepID=A0AAD5MKQ4_PARTN|nr:hypothetical protein KIN20_019198 [Parelaphostrongylus tenuis]
MSEIMNVCKDRLEIEPILSIGVISTTRITIYNYDFDNVGLDKQNETDVLDEVAAGPD